MFTRKGETPVYRRMWTTYAICIDKSIREWLLGRGPVRTIGGNREGQIISPQRINSNLHERYNGYTPKHDLYVYGRWAYLQTHFLL